MPTTTSVTPELSDPLIVDLYELTMFEAYIEAGMHGPASFELFIRRLPASRNFLVAAGLEQALQFLERFRVSREALAQIEQVHPLSPAARAALADLRFSGDVRAIPEGTVVFADEPLLRVSAPLPVAQLVETRLLNLIHFQTVVASKAARSVLAAGGRPLVDFGLRRAHGGEAGTFAARAAYIAGFGGTSNVRAGVDFGLPVFGTMAHSFVQAHEDERRAFVTFATARPGGVTLLIDTYDTEAAAAAVVGLAPELAARGVKVAAVRLDSGDLAAHARRVRRILDDGGLRDTRIIASSGIDEHAIAALVAAAAPIDRFAPGTRVVTSADAPYLDCAYKLVEYAGRPRVKRSEGKGTWPGPKQIWRQRDAAGRLAADHLTTADEQVAGAEPLLVPVMRSGRRVAPPPSLEVIRARARLELGSLPDALRSLEPAPRFAPRPSAALRAALAQAEE
ncbi:MAG TPA: nicotinate phosphoribosyltransferase [Polyangia bacterium]